MMERKRIITFAVCITILALAAGCQNNKTEDVPVTDQTKATEQTTVESTTVELTTVEPTTVEITTQTPTPPPTEVPKTKEEVLKEGLWIKYSPQAPIFDLYQFGDDGIVEKTQYFIHEEIVEKYNSTNAHTFGTYRVRGNQILITEQNNIEWTWYFTDNEDTLEYAFQDGYGGETYTVSQKIRRHDSLPNYDTAMTEWKTKG